MKGNSKWVLTILIVVMLFYQAWRVYDYIRSSLTGVSDNTSFWVAMAFLAFTEIGLLTWLHIGLPQANTRGQSGVATILVWADFVFSMLIGLADIAMHNTLYIIDLSLINPLLFFAPWLVVVANLGGYILYHQWDADMESEKADRELEYEEHSVLIAGKRQAIKEIRTDKKVLADKIKPGYYRRMVDNASGRSAKELNKQADILELNEADRHQATDNAGILEGIRGLVDAVRQKNGKIDPKEIEVNPPKR